MKKELLKELNINIVNQIYIYFSDELDIILVDRYFFIREKIMSIKNLKIFDRTVKNFVYQKFKTREKFFKITKISDRIDILPGKQKEAKKFMKKF